MGTRVKVTYVAMSGHKPIMTASTFEELRAGLDDYYAVHTGQAKCLGFTPYNTKYPDDYEGYYEYEWKREIRTVVGNEITIETDKIPVFCVEYYPHTIYEI